MTENSKNDRKTVLAVAGLLALLTFVVYHGLLRNDFITLDDRAYIVSNLHVTAGLTMRGIIWAFKTNYQCNWHPLTWLSHMLDYTLYGGNPAGHHATSLLIHVANVLLLFFVLRRMTSRLGSAQAGSLWRSAFVAALFAIHPVHVESVAWAAERKDVLSAFFWLLTMWAYVRYTESPLRSRYALVMLTFALGLMAKPVLVTLPFVLLLLDYWPLDRLSTSRKSKDRWTNRVWEKVPLLIMSAASSLITYLVQRGAMSPIDAIPIGARIANAIVAYQAYIWKMLWPNNLAIMYPHRFESLPHWLVLCSALLLAVMTSAVLMARKHRYVLVGWLWYLGTLIPMIGLVQVGLQAMADRYTYIPLIGLFIILAWGIGELGEGRAWGRAMAPLACAAILALALVARIQVGYWKNTYTIFSHANKVTPNNHVALTELGHDMQTRGRLDDATRYYARALQLVPDSELAHLGLGVVLVREGKRDEGIRHFRAAIAARPKFEEGHYALARALAEEGKFREATQHFDEAIRLNPEDTLSYHGLGDILVRQHRLGEAILAYQKALDMNPKDSAADYKIAMTLIKERNIPGAMPYFEQAIKLRPNFREAHYNLGIALASQGDLDGAISHLTKAVEIKPKYSRARERLAQAYYAKGDYAAAWKQVRLCRTNGYNPDPEFVQALAEKMPEK